LFKSKIEFTPARFVTDSDGYGLAPKKLSAVFKSAMLADSRSTTPQFSRRLRLVPPRVDNKQNTARLASWEIGNSNKFAFGIGHAQVNATATWDAG
jgi:hypothetical protein